MHILIVEDDVGLADQLATALRGEGHDVEIHRDGASGRRAFDDSAFNVAIIDRMLPQMDGLDLIADLRESGDRTPVLILSALAQVDDRVAGLRAGGDDYLTKPYAFSELLARIEVLARRAEDATSERHVRIGDLTLDRIDHVAERDGQTITLQPREYRLLDYLMRNAGRLVTRTMLLEHVWNLHFDPQTNVIDVHISRLRAKIDKGFDRPLLHTIRGKGYRLADHGEGG